MSVGLSTIREAWVGTTTVQCHVDADVMDISRRLREGDPTITWKGRPWLGDSTLSLCLGVPIDSWGEPLDNAPAVYEVWGIDVQHTPYLVLRWPRADASMLAELIKGDNRVINVVDELERHNAGIDAAKRSDDQARNEETADKLHFALRRDQGQHFGGLRKRIY